MQLTVDSGQLPVGWKVKKLAEVCQVEKSQGIYKNLPYIGMENIESNTAKFIGSTELQSVKSSTFRFNHKHILYGRLRPYLNKVLAPDFEGHCSTEIFPIKPSECLNRYFLLYWLLMDSTVKCINATCTGARMPRANMNSVFEFDFPLPPLTEQKRIVAILDEAFEGIDRAIANAEKNLANSRELFESYLNAIFTQKGDGWVQSKLSEVCEKITDGTHQTPKYFETGFVFLSSRNVTSGTINWDKVKYVDEAQHIAMQKRISPRLHDILLAKNGTTGVAALVDKDIDFDIYVSLALLRPLAAILPRFMLHFVNSPVAKGQFNKRLKGIGVPNLHLEEIREVTICYPQDLALQEAIVVKIDEMRSQILRLETIYRQKIAALNELKQSILQKAFTGELTADTPKTVKEEIAA